MFVLGVLSRQHLLVHFAHSTDAVWFTGKGFRIQGRPATWRNSEPSAQGEENISAEGFPSRLRLGILWPLGEVAGCVHYRRDF